MITEKMARDAGRGCFKFRSFKESERFYRVLSKWSGPTSVCTCGHAGNGPPDATVVGLHAGPIGHGACIVKGCSCARFTHYAWTTDYVVAIVEARSVSCAELTPAMRALLHAVDVARPKVAVSRLALRPAVPARGSSAKRAPVSAAVRRQRRRASMSPAEKERLDNGDRYWSDDAAAARRSRS